ncbi:MAG: putative transrane protein [Thermoleophilia bacterium]|nr:putative transrane protein [Thermoleophilia bacterium]
MAPRHDSNGLPGRRGDDALQIDQAASCFSFLRSVPILFEVDDTTLWDIARTAEEREFDPGTRIISQGDGSPVAQTDDAHRFFVIRSGSADVMRSDHGGRDRTVARLSVGSYFGELGLLTNQARNATVRVHGDKPLRTYSFDALTFHRRIAEHVLVFRVLRDRDAAVTAPPPAHLLEPEEDDPARGRLRIKELALLRRLPQRDLDFMLDHAEQRTHGTDEEIIREGDLGDRFYILLDGHVDILRSDEIVARLQPGDFFGETALLLDTPRTASVRAAGDGVETWSITRSAFQRVVGGYLLSNPQTQDEIVRRMRDALPPEGESA